MNYNTNNLVPYIAASEYDQVAEEFLAMYYPDALQKPIPIPIEEIARDKMGLDVKYICLSEELDVYGMTIFTDGSVEIYNPDAGLYEIQIFKKKTILIDPKAVKKTNMGCKNNTIAHECVHWYKHRLYYKMQYLALPRLARYCKCLTSQLPYSTVEEDLMEKQAVSIAPRILMPKSPFMDIAIKVGIKNGRDNLREICMLADYYDVSKQSVKIRLKECGLI